MMENLESINPNTMPEKAVKKVLQEINDERVRANEHPDFFKIHSNDDSIVISVPKQELIYSTERGNVKVVDFIKEQLERLDKKEQED